ncbi:hypothetical protein BJ508DRAFT_309892 [Ascobolus immersus RN42]|uniref:Uncharacterized protein n=1 Tax=Ascobolus immersus RN42 TaxID=1160509 RepID=A0A3N4I103_ASCIM|nr:hypothetical protein BJ508DRAFT_309892 [Ascobolus immersus RN42]
MTRRIRASKDQRDEHGDEAYLRSTTAYVLALGWFEVNQAQERYGNLRTRDRLILLILLRTYTIENAIDTYMHTSDMYIMHGSYSLSPTCRVTIKGSRTDKPLPTLITKSRHDKEANQPFHSASCPFCYGYIPSLNTAINVEHKGTARTDGTAYSASKGSRRMPKVWGRSTSKDYACIQASDKIRHNVFEEDESHAIEKYISTFSFDGTGIHGSRFRGSQGRKGEILKEVSSWSILWSPCPARTYFTPLSNSSIGLRQEERKRFDFTILYSYTRTSEDMDRKFVRASPTSAILIYGSVQIHQE